MCGDCAGRPKNTSTMYHDLLLLYVDATVCTSLGWGKSTKRVFRLSPRCVWLIVFCAETREWNVTPTRPVPISVPQSSYVIYTGTDYQSYYDRACYTIILRVR